MAHKKESIIHRWKRRIIEGNFERSELVILYPVTLYTMNETIPLPAPYCTDNREYLSSSTIRRIMSIVARIIQIILYGVLIIVLAHWATLLDASSLGNVVVVIVSGVAVLFLLLNIIHSVRYIQWQVRNLHTTWSR